MKRNTNKIFVKDDASIKIKALAEYLDIPEDEVHEGWDENNFETDNDGDYIVCDYDTAYSLALEDVRESYRDMGLDAFSENFQQYILDNLLDEKALQDTMYEDIKTYYNGAYDDEILEFAESHGLIDNIYDYDGDIDELREKLIDEDYSNYEDNPSEYYIYMMGEDYFREWVKKNDYVDIDGVARNCVMEDGVAHFVARYDDYEINLGHDLYAYRTN